MTRRETALRLYGRASDRPALAWSWVEQQLTDAGTFWVVGRTQGHPHPRPVWGVWHAQRLHLSLGSPALVRAVRQDPAVTVHLESGTDVVIVEGFAAAGLPNEQALIHAYNRKYDWDYRVEQYGHLTSVEPTTVMAWRAAGPAGRDSFAETGCWTFEASRKP